MTGHSRTLGGPATRHRLLGRLALSIALAVAGPLVAHSPTATVAATCLPGYQCATVYYHLTGDGSGSVTSNPSGAACAKAKATSNLLCPESFSWSSGDPYLDIDLAFTPAADSYACLYPEGQPELCHGVATTLNSGISVYDGETLDIYGAFKAAHALHLTLSIHGTGSGRATSSPPGIDCRAVAGTTSGTCQRTWYFTEPFPFRISYTPSATSWFCATWLQPGSCPGLGETYDFDSTAYSDNNLTIAASLNLGTKVTAAVQGHGTVTSGGGGISCPSKCTAYYKPDILVGLVAKPASGYAFTGWAGACSGETVVCNLAVNAADLSTTAIFAKIATPPPSKAPATTPSSAPQPTAQPNAPTGSPAASAEETAGPSPAAPSSSPGEIAAEGTAPPTGDPGAAGGPTTPAGQGPELLPAVIAFLIVVLVIALLGGYVLGRRRSAASPSSDTDE
jgi:uncharacterized repeat protein (TIGR02543 family)